jgi:hypothetical protein
MSDSFSELTPEELQELILHGRINTSRSKARKKEQKREPIVRIPRDPPKPVIKAKEQDADWVKLQAEKAKKNIAAPKDDVQRNAERQEASKF